MRALFHRCRPSCFSVEFSTHTRWTPRSSASTPPSTPASAKSPTLKQTLRRLFLKVHPDLFDQHPLERDTNAKSFALLTSVVDVLKMQNITQSPQSSAPGGPIDLVFYLRPDIKSDAASAEKKDSPPAFRKIAVSFPALNSRTVDTRLLGVIREGLGKLFALSDLEPNFVLRERESTSTRAQKERGGISINTFLSGLANEERTPVQTSIVSHVLMLEYRMQGMKFLWEGCGSAEPERRKVMEQFKAVLSSINWQSKFELTDALEDAIEGEMGALPLTELEKAAKAAKLALKESTPPTNARFPFDKTVIVFSNTQGSHVDSRGRLVFAAHDAPEKWVEFLHSDISEQIEERQNALKFTRQMQSEVAEVLGIHDIFCEPLLLTEPMYVRFLSRLKESKPLFDELFSQREQLAKLSLRVQRASTFSVDQVIGMVHVPLHSGPRNVIDFLTIRGAEALRINEEYSFRAEEFKEASLRVKRRLRLKGLIKDPSVSHAEMQEACHNLSVCPPDYHDMFYGLQLRIATQYAAVDEEGWVTIPFDFFYDGVFPFNNPGR